MRLFSVLLILLASGCSILPQGGALSAAAQDQAPPAVEHETDGACEDEWYKVPYPSSAIERQAPASDMDAALRSYERRCILRAKPFAVRRGEELRLTFRNGTART
jgi:hypothetical protein